MEYLDMINKLLEILGNVSLSEAKDWVAVKENAEALRAEGHENDLNPTAETGGQ
jgi:hypothetical protein